MPSAARFPLLVVKEGGITRNARRGLVEVEMMKASDGAAMGAVSDQRARRDQVACVGGGLLNCGSRCIILRGIRMNEAHLQLPMPVVLYWRNCGRSGLETLTASESAAPRVRVRLGAWQCLATQPAGPFHRWQRGHSRYS